VSEELTAILSGPQAIALPTGRSIGVGHPAFLVAEIGQNHNGEETQAAELIDVAAWAGVDAVKFTKRDLECEMTRQASRVPYSGRSAFGPTYGEHRAALELSIDAHERLAARAQKHGLVYFAAACDIPSADLLGRLDVPLYKIASRDLTNSPLVEHLARTGRPLLISTGMSSLEEIDEAVEVVHRHHDCLVLLQCTSLYPTPPEQVHLRSLPALGRRYGCLVGFSDHADGTLFSAVAVALGAVLIEKHLTFDRKARGSDHACSLEPSELRELVRQVRQVEQAMGRSDKPRCPGVDKVRMRLGRSLVSRVSVPRGATLVEEMLVLKSPGNGLAWRDRHRVLGRQARRDIAPDETLRAADFC
jgi:sialic acid synthase SpsE